MRRIVLLLLGGPLILAAALRALVWLGGRPSRAHRVDCRQGDVRLRSQVRERWS